MTSTEVLSRELESLTVVIPTRDRPAFVRRQISYWKNLPVTLVIVEEDAQISTSESRFGATRVIHSKSPRSFTERLVHSCSLIDTDFVVFSSDDDLYLPLGLATSIQQLKATPSVVGSLGSSMRFSVRRRQLFGQIINSENLSSSQSTQDRVSRVLNNYRGQKISNPMFGVYRSAVWRDVTRTAYGTLYSSAYVYEFLWATLMLYRGSIQVHDALTWLSSAENVTTMDSNNFNRRIEITQWLTDARFTNEVAAMKEGAVCWMASHGYDSRTELRQMLELHIQTLLARYQRKLSKRRQYSIRQAVLRLLPRIPAPLVAGLRATLPRFLKRQLGLDIFHLDTQWRFLSKRNVVFLVHEMEKFRNAVIDTKH